MSDGRRRVGLLFGGRTPEHEVSVVSARGVFSGFDRATVDPVPIAADLDGAWLSRDRSLRILEGDVARVEPSDGDDGVRILADPGGGLVVRDARGGSGPLALDAILSVVHGWGGEDGRVQGMLDLAGVPYVGAGVTGSALAMDKGFARAVVEGAGMPLAPWSIVRESAWRADRDGTAGSLLARPGLPMFVKPANGGSSVGVRRVSRADALDAALEHAFAYDRRVVVERAVDAREIEVAVLGNDAPEASVPGEIVPGAEFYTYEDKYVDGAARLLVPAPLDRGMADDVRRLAIDAYRALDLAGMARVDFLLERSTGALLFNEANTLPGFTPISMYSKLWEASGLPYPRLLDRLVDLAIERHRSERARRRT